MSFKAPRGLIPAYPAWGVVPLARDGATLLEYRMAGQRGSRPHRASVPGDVWDAEVAQAELETVTGPIAKLRIVGTVRAARPGVVVTRDDEPIQPTIPLVASPRAPRAIIEDVFVVNGHVVETAMRDGQPRAGRAHRGSAPRRQGAAPKNGARPVRRPPPAPGPTRPCRAAGAMTHAA